MSKIDKITPQIAALYLGAKCDAFGPKAVEITEYYSKGEDYLRVFPNFIQEIANGRCDVILHLRRMDSITEQEAREIYEISKGDPWETRMEWMDEDDEDRSALRNYWNNTDEWYTDEKNMEIGRPRVWLYLLSKGFDLFSLIESGLAKEIKPETVNA